MLANLKLSFYLLKIGIGIKSIVNHRSFLIIEVKKEYIALFLKLLKEHSFLKYDYLLDIWGVDYPGLLNRFEVNYLVTSVSFKINLIIRVKVKEHEGLPSISNLFSSSSWLEREIWDMYGVVFYNNIDLRRILTDYGFEGHPLRKDFPLSGFYEVRYDDEYKRVVYEALEVGQEYRYYKFNSPWESL